MINVRHIISFILPVLGLLAVGCSNDDIAMEMEVGTASGKVAFTPVGDPIKVTLNLSAVPFEDDEALTRAEVLSDDQTVDETSKIETGALDMEKYMYTFWIFEFDASDSTLVNDPYYYKPSQYENTGEHTFEDITLSSNKGKPVILYAIVNANEDYDIKDWVKLDEATGEYTGFMSISELEAQALPSDYKYDVSHTFTTNKWPPFFSSSTGSGWTRFIPKSGWTEPLVLSEKEDIEIPVTNMYAKIIPYLDNSTSKSVIQGNFLVENVPLYCRVGALADSLTTEAFDYTQITDLQWTYFSVAGLSSYGQYGSESGSHAMRVWYLPENIQGEVSDYDEGATRESLVPKSQYTVTIDESTGETTTTKDCDIPATPSSSSNPQWDESWSCAKETDALVVHFYYRNSTAKENKCCTLYPGGNNTNNFNVRRNCTYRVKYILKGE